MYVHIAQLIGICSIIPLLWLTQEWTVTKRIIEYSRLSESNFLLLLLCLNWTTNERSIPVGYLFRLLVQDHQSPLLFSGVIAEWVDGVGDKGSGDTTMVDVHSWRFFFWTCHCDLSVSLIKLFSVIKKTSSLVTPLLNIQIIWISDLLGIRWKEFCCSCISGKQCSVYAPVVF
jgi:hypothetical protein